MNEIEIFFTVQSKFATIGAQQKNLNAVTPYSNLQILTQVDSWIDFCAHEIELPATIWCYPVIGYMPYNHAAVSKAKEDLKTALGALEKALLEKTYLVRTSCARSWLCCEPVTR